MCVRNVREICMQMPSCEELASFPYAEAVIQESMRLYPPAFLTTRMVRAARGWGGCAGVGGGAWVTEAVVG